MFLSIVAGTLLAGCSFKQPSPAKQSYLLEPVRVGEARNSASPVVLRVRGVQVAAPFEGRGFVYRTSELGYTVDFYHEFLTAPRNMIAGQLQSWLGVSGLFRGVISSGGAGDATHVIDANVSALFADFRNPSAPKSVFAVEFLVWKEGGVTPGLVFQKSYRQEVVISERQGEAVAKGLSGALEKVLAALEADMATAQLK